MLPNFSGVLNSIIQKLKDTNKPAMFILGERINEWRQVYKKPATKEFDLNHQAILKLIGY